MWLKCNINKISCEKKTWKWTILIVSEKCVKMSDECVFTPNITPIAVSTGLNILN